MKLFMETDTGSRIEVKEVASINPDAKLLIFFIKRNLRQSDLNEIQNSLCIITNKQCLALDDVFKETIYGI